MDSLEKKEVNSLSIALIRYYLELNNIKLDEVYNEAPILEEMIINQTFLSHNYFLKLVEKLEKKINDPEIIEKVGQIASCLSPKGLIKGLIFKVLNTRKIISYYPKYFKYFYNNAELKIIENNAEKTIVEIYFPSNLFISSYDKKFIKGLLSSIPIKKHLNYFLEEIDENPNIYVVIFKWNEKRGIFLNRLSSLESNINNVFRHIRKKVNDIKKIKIKNNVKVLKTPKIKIPKFNIKMPRFKKIKLKINIKKFIAALFRKFKREKPEIIDLRRTIREEILENENKFIDREEEKEKILNEPSIAFEEAQVNVNYSEITEDIQDKFENIKQKLKEEIEFTQKMRNLNNKLINKIEYLEKVNLDLSNEIKTERINIGRLKEDVKSLKENLENLKIKKNTFVYDIVQNLKGPILRIVTSLEIVKNSFSTEDEDQNDFLKEAINASHDILSLVGYSIEFNREVDCHQNIENRAQSPGRPG